MQRENISTVWCARVYEVTILATIFGFLFSTAIYAQSETETVDFDIPSLALPQALNEFARQASVELVFAERGFDGVQANAVVGSFEKERALELLLAGTGLRVGYGSGDSVIIQREQMSEVTADLAIGDSATGVMLMAQAAVDTSQDSGSLQGAEHQAERATEKGDDAEKAPAFEEILVTGSRIRGAESASPVVTITRQEIDQAGFATVDQIIESLPQNFGAGASPDTNSDTSVNSINVVGGVVDSRGGSTSVNLRGLGTGSTLVLLNGRRLSPSGLSGGFTNISSIPVTAIERVEVLTDGASAIYGSDAIGGVVNFILRDNYDGAETRLRYGVAKGGARPEVLFGQSFGKSWNTGNVLLSYEYYDTDNLASSDRDITSTNDLRRFGGTDYRSLGGSPANIRATLADGTNQFFAIPTGQDGTGLTAADFDPNTSLNRYNDRALVDVTRALERHSAFLHLTQEIGSAELFAAARFSSQETLGRGSFGTRDITVTDSNPFFVDPTGTGLTSVIVDNYSFDDDLGVFQASDELDSLGATLGVQFNIGTNWNGELVGNWSKEESISLDAIDLDMDAINAAANPTNPGDPVFNPFGDGSNTTPAVLESFFVRSSRGSPVENELWQVNLNVDGEVFDTAGGTAKVAAGIEYRDDSLLATSDFSGTTFDSDRNILAVYGEVFIPLVGDSNSRPGLRRLELSVAGRYEDYSDFGSDINPKVGLAWAPTQTFMLRGTYGTSFKAPTLRDMDFTRNVARYFPQRFVDLGVLPTTFIALSGVNEDLKPEEATTWTAGFDWSPERISGLSLKATYFNIDFQDRIAIPTNSVVAASNDPRFASIFNTNPTQEQIDAIVGSPNWIETFAGVTTTLADVQPGGASPVGAILNLQRTNLSQVVVTGADLQVSYNFETALGSFAMSLNGTYMFDFERKLVKADPLVDEVDQLGRPVDFRARGTVSWSRGDWDVSTFVNYTDGYTDNVYADPDRQISSWTVVDLSVGYEIGDERGFISNTRLSLSTRNLFDRDPPFVNTFGGLAYDSVNADPLGRFMSIQATKEW